MPVTISSMLKDALKNFPKPGVIKELCSRDQWNTSEAEHEWRISDLSALSWS